MTRLTIDVAAIEHNYGIIDAWMSEHHAGWTVVTKAICGNTGVLTALTPLNIRSVADSRVMNLETVKSTIPNAESWCIRIPHLTEAEMVVNHSDVSLNSEVEVLRRLGEAAGRQHKLHKVILMVELGDLREGILPSDLTEFYDTARKLTGIQIIGIGTNFSCISGFAPTQASMIELIFLRNMLEIKFNCKLPVISAGATVVLPLLLEGKLPREINHFRIGEALFLGSDLVNGGVLPGLRDDAFMLEAEIVEIKKKQLASSGEIVSATPFHAVNVVRFALGQTGYRAIVDIGQLDTDVSGLRPVNPRHQIAGASSDMTVVNIGDDVNGLKVGDSIKFKTDYAATVRLMGGKYIPITVKPRA